MSSSRFSNKYDTPSMRAAVEKLKNKEMSIRVASNTFGVPKSTLHDRLSGKFPEEKLKVGPKTVLTNVEEKKVVDWIISLTKCGFPVKQEDIIDTIQNIIKTDGRVTPFNNGRPGRKWFSLFLKRHPEIVPRTPEGLSKGRAVVTEEGIRQWFRELHTYLRENKFEDILSDPRRILNGDETGFSLCPTSGKVIAPKGYKNVYRINPGKDKETLTVLLVFSANGNIVPPMVVFPYVRPPKEVTNSIPDTWFLGRSSSGWMVSEVFYDYVTKGVLGWIKEENIPTPILLFVDGHKSHLSYKLSAFCSNNGIILYALPPNTMHLMQPADVSVFKPLKSEWNKTVSTWQRKGDNINKIVTKATFCPLLASVLQMPTLKTSIINGFRKCGLFPFNPDSVDYSKCVRDTLQNLNEPTAPFNLSAQFCNCCRPLAENLLSRIKENLSKKGFNSEDIFENISLEEDFIDSEDINVVQNLESDIDNFLFRSIEEACDHEFIFINNEGTSNPGGETNEDFDLISRNKVSLDSALGNNSESGTHENNTTLPNSVTESLGMSQQAEPITLQDVRDPLISKENQFENRFEFRTQSDLTFPLSQSAVPEFFPTTAKSSTPTVKQLDNVSSSLKRRPRSSLVYSPVLAKYLKIPKTERLLPKTRKVLKEKAPSAISSKEWRSIIEAKEEEKQRKMKEIAQRKEERLKKKNIKCKMSCKKNKQTEKVAKRKGGKFKPIGTQRKRKGRRNEICGTCNEELISDIEEDGLKNIGCDMCPKWYHLKCTSFSSFEEAENNDFLCESCKNNM